MAWQSTRTTIKANTFLAANDWLVENFHLLVPGMRIRSPPIITPCGAFHLTLHAHYNSEIWFTLERPEQATDKMLKVIIVFDCNRIVYADISDRVRPTFKCEYKLNDLKDKLKSGRGNGKDVLIELVLKEIFVEHQATIPSRNRDVLDRAESFVAGCFSRMVGRQRTKALEENKCDKMYLLTQ